MKPTDIKNILVDVSTIVLLLSSPAAFVFAGFTVYQFSLTANLPYSFTGVISFLVMLSLLYAIILWVGFHCLINRAEHNRLYTYTTEVKEIDK